jgi:hypothetical protein
MFRLVSPISPLTGDSTRQPFVGAQSDPAILDVLSGKRKVMARSVSWNYFRIARDPGAIAK